MLRKKAFGTEGEEGQHGDRLSQTCSFCSYKVQPVRQGPFPPLHNRRQAIYMDPWGKRLAEAPSGIVCVNGMKTSRR
jgi:hypothetical protein